MDKSFIYFILNEFIENIDTDKYYEKYKNMDIDSLYCYMLGKYSATMQIERNLKADE